jgi:hypothetical protein
MPDRGQFTGNRGLMTGVGIGTNVKRDFVDDAVAMIAKKRAIPMTAVKLKNVAIDIPTKQTDENGKRTVVIKPAVDIVILGHFSSLDEKIVISQLAGTTKTPVDIMYSYIGEVVPVVLDKDYEYEFSIQSEESSFPASTDLLLVGVQVGDLPTDLVQYTIKSDTGAET